MINYSEDKDQQSHIQVAQGEVGRYGSYRRSETLRKDRGTL